MSCTTRYYNSKQLLSSPNFQNIKKLAKFRGEGLAQVYKRIEELPRSGNSYRFSVVFVDSVPVSIAFVDTENSYFQAFTLPEFRNKGYAKKAVTFLSKKVKISNKQKVSCWRPSKMNKVLNSVGFLNIEQV